MSEPASYSAETADMICEQLADGISLRAICRQEGAPTRRTVRYWLETVPAFAAQYARAREDQAHTLADEIVAISDDEMDPQRARVRIDARKWYAGKLHGKYSDRQQVEHSGPGGGPIKTEDVVDPLERARALAFLWRQAVEAKGEGE